MKKNDTIYTLQQNIEIPDIVTEKANMAFEQIRKDAGSSDKIVTYQKPVKKSRKKYMVAALIATLTVGAVSAYAAYTNWSHGMKEELRISEEQQKESGSKRHGSIFRCIRHRCRCDSNSTAEYYR